MGVVVHPANAHDSVGAHEVIDTMRAKYPNFKKILADGGYKRQKLIDAVQDKLNTKFTVILRPDESSKKFSVLPLRWILDRSFAWLENFRRIAINYEFHADTGVAMVQIAFYRLMLNKILDINLKQFLNLNRKKTMIRKLALTVTATLALLGLQAQTMSQEDWFMSPRNEISLSYGLMSINDFSTIMNNFFPSVGEIDGRPVWATGSINLGYTYQLYENLTVGGMFGYSGNMGNMTERGAVMKNFFSIMPQAKYEWYRSGKIKLYSRLAAGVLVVSINNASGNTGIPDKTAASFTFQASPIGVEIGRYVAFFAEAGFGATGVLTIGIKKVF